MIARSRPRFRSCLGIFLVALAIGAPRIFGDHIVLQRGTRYEGKILRENDKEVVIQVGRGSFTFPRSMIREVVVTSDSLAPTPVSLSALPAQEAILRHAQSSSWSLPFRQIPATVIDVGVLRHVPYSSYRMAGRYELNIYGDPADPAGMEVGIYQPPTHVGPEKQNCLALVSKLVPALAKIGRFNGLNFAGDSFTVGTFTIEVTPPNAPDAYGAWWVSVYDLTKLDAAGATPTELDALSTSHAAVSTPRSAEPEWQPADLAEIRRSAATTSQDQTSPQSKIHSVTPSTYPSTNVGRVYVRSYVRKDGTYVRGHSRKR